MKFLNKKRSRNLIYIHGFSADKNDHPLLESHAKKCGYNLYSFDLLSHGSNKNKQDINDVKFDDLVDYCVAKIRSFRLDSFVIFGHSMGGAITSIIAGNKYFKNELKGIILESPHNNTTVLRSRYSIKSAISLIKKSMVAKNEDPKLNVYFSNLRQEKKEYLPLFTNIMLPSTLVKIQKGIKRINVKTLLLVANEDIYVPYRDTRENFSKNVDNLEVHVIKDAGHCISVDKPNEFYKYFDHFLLEIAKENE